MNAMNGFRIGMLCIMLAVLCMPPHAPAVDSVIGGICVVFLFLVVSGYRRVDA
jgi:hypothetical protein